MIDEKVALPDHYRFSEYGTADGVRIICEKYIVLSETPKGYWAIQDYYASFPENFLKRRRKWVSKNSGKRFCYPTKAEAFRSYVYRKRKHVQHAEYRLGVAREAYRRAVDLEDDLAAIENFPLGYGGVLCGRPDIFNEFSWD